VETRRVADTLAASAEPSLSERYCEVRSRTEELARPLSPEDQAIQSMPDVSPTKWHRAHTSWFFEEFILGPHSGGYTVHHPQYRYLFNSYYEAVGPRHPRPRRGMLSRPSAAEVGEYRRHVDTHVLGLAGSSLPPGAADLIVLGLHHEEQHQELLLMDIKHVLAQNPLQPVYRATQAPRPSPGTPLDWLSHPGGIVEVGADEGGFSFDNERPRHQTLLAPFELATRAVTNAEWIEFIRDDGYSRPELWLSDGWATIVEQGWSAPLYWSAAEDGWEQFTLGGTRPVEPSEPVCHVSYYEADAYAHWAGARLPTEFEWEAVAAERAVDGRFLDLRRLHPCAATGPGVQQLYGDVWEWTSSAYSPYPGFVAASGAVGEYNGKFMVNQYVLRGGCCATPPGHVRATYRNFFPASARWAFSGVRLAR
jgi:ergothioneine biosynthesis protein EgtB